MSLNLFNVSNARASAAKIAAVVPKSCYVPLSRHNLSTIKFIPSKDYSMNRLVSGLLQLSAGTHLILDETQLQEGALDATGEVIYIYITALYSPALTATKHIQALAQLIKWQKVAYDFEFYPSVEYPTDIPCLILSASKSVFEVLFTVLPVLTLCTV
jgi:hypothetical protein